MRKKHPIKEKTAFTRTATTMVEHNILLARSKYMHSMIDPWDKNMDWILRRLFPGHILEYLRIGYEHTSDYARSHNFCSWNILSDVTLQVKADFWHKQKMLPPREEYKSDPKIAVPELVAYCMSVREILFNYAKVSHVFEWFNNCGSSAVAMRSYCPWIQTVLPSEYHHCMEGTKFREPGGLASMLNLIKEVSGIMGRANLIQNDIPNKNKQELTLYFNPTTINTIHVPSYVMEC